MHHSELTIRPITGPEELDLFNTLPYVINHELADDLDQGRRRPGWMWIALRGERLLARVAWWAHREGEPPAMLDIFDLADDLSSAERRDLGVQLVETAMAAVEAKDAEYSRFLPPTWHDDEQIRQGVEDRMAVLGEFGGRLLVERLRLHWAPGTPIAGPSERLTFRPVRDRDELVTLMTVVLEGTLDAHSLVELTEMTPEQSASAQYDNELATFRTPHDWWRVGVSPDGEPVGFVIPARNSYNPIIAYVGVLPAHRGHGYIDDLLAEGTRILAAQNVPHIRASTDIGNVPMARAFDRAGYAVFEREINMTWS